VLYKLIKLLSDIVCWLPVFIRRQVGNILGEICWLIVPAKRRNMAVGNIVRSLGIPEQDAVRIAKQSTTRFGRMFMEVLAFPVIKRNINQYVRIVGKENMIEALAHGRGAVLATAHSGNWELLGGALALNGFPMIGVAQKQTNEQMDQFINEYRTLVGMHVTYKSGVREMIRLLGEGKVIGMLMDQNAGRNGVIVNFFNRPASAPQGPAFLARMKNAPIVPAFITENKDGTHTVIVKEPVWVNQTEHREQDILAATQQLTSIIEQHIQAYPHEWFWLHNRWKYTEKKGYFEKK